MVTNAAQKVARQQLHRSSPQCFLLPLATEHKQLLLLLLTEGLAVAYLKKKEKKVESQASVLKVDLVLLVEPCQLQQILERAECTLGPSKQRRFLTPTFTSYVSTLRA